MDTTKQQTSSWEKFVEIIEEEKKQQNEEKANNDCIGEECDGHCNADDVEECDDCGIKLRIGSECDPSDHSIFNGMCDDCREMEIEKEPYCFKDTTIDTVENDICFCSVGGCVKPTEFD